MPNMKDVLEHPDFWNPETTDDDRKYALSKADKKFAGYAPSQQDIFLKNQQKLYQEQQQREDRRKQEGLQVAQEGEAKQQPQSLFNKYIAQPLNNVVGMGMEALTEPLVHGTDISKYGSTVGAGGAAKKSREAAASAVVPQEPWQAALYAAGPVAGKLGGAVPALSGVVGRLGTAAALGGAAELAGGDMEQSPLARTLSGATKAGATAAIPEVVGGLSGMGARLNILGGRARVAEDDARRLAPAIKEIAPEFNVPVPRPGTPFQGKESGEKMAKFFEGGGAQQASKSAWGVKAAQMDQDLVARQAPQWIKDPEVEGAYKVIAKAYNKPGLQVAQRLAPDPYMGFKPSQAAEILATYRDALGVRNPNIKGHITQEGLDNIENRVAAQLPPDIAAKFREVRAGFAKQSAIRELLEKAFPGGNKGAQLDMSKVQQAIEDPEIMARLGTGGSKLRDVIMRQPNAKFKAQDVPENPGQYIGYPSLPGQIMFGVRQATHGSKYIGKPLQATANQRGALRNLITPQAQMQSERLNRKEEE